MVLSTVAGFQVPVIPLLDVVGRTGAADPLQIAAGVVNTGTICCSSSVSNRVSGYEFTNWCVLNCK